MGRLGHNISVLSGQPNGVYNGVALTYRHSNPLRRRDKGDMAARAVSVKKIKGCETLPVPDSERLRLC